QAEDGIRVFHVTGVQTCALPICGAESFTGRTAVLQAATGSTGRALFEGAWWDVRSPDAALQKGQSVRVVGVDGLTLLVEPTDTTDRKSVVWERVAVARAGVRRAK